MNHFQGSSKSLPPLDSDRNTRISRKICQSEFAWCILLYQPLFPISSVKRRNGSKRHFECLSERVLNSIQWFIIIIPVNQPYWGHPHHQLLPRMTPSTVLAKITMVQLLQIGAYMIGYSSPHKGRLVIYSNIDSYFLLKRAVNISFGGNIIVNFN